MMMQTLNLPAAGLKFRDQNGHPEVFDEFRKKYVVLTPEEWVRQHFIHYLVNEKHVPASLIHVEASLKYNRLAKRSDVLVYSRSGNPCLIVECKAPEVKITQAVFDQVAMYNMTMKVDYLVVTNGMEHFACIIDHEKRTYGFLKEIPDYEEMTAL
jgi:hypothetical protein